MGIKFLSLLILFFFQVLRSQAQEIVYYPEPPIVQRLAWLEDPNALHYEVLIEIEEDGIYSSLVREISDALFIELSLAPGSYRFGVIPYDLLGRLAEEPEWRSFQVLPALRPEPTEFSPRTFFLDGETILRLNIYGRNLLEGAEISLRRLDEEDDPIIPGELHVLDHNREAYLLFEARQLEIGVYEIHIRNPGGMESGIRGFTVTIPARGEISPQRAAAGQVPRPGLMAEENLKIMYAEIGWAPVLNISGKTERLFGEKFVPMGALARAGLIFPNQSLFSFGIELGLSYFVYLTSLNIYETGGQSAVFEFNLLMQSRLGQDLTYLIRSGIGLTQPISYTQSIEQTHKPERSAHVNLGASLVKPLLEGRLYLGGGLDLSLSIGQDRPSTFMRPWLGVGRRF